VVVATTQNGLSRAGVGLRLPHLAEVAATRPPAAWFEIHPENFLPNQHATELLIDIARDYPISVHTVGLSVGSAGGIDRAHLRRVRDLVDKIDPILVSGHLAWSAHAGEFLNDLLPLPYDEETLRLVARHVNEVQDSLGRSYLLENPSNYLGFGHSTMNEAVFLTELVRRTGCKLLCDVSNIHLSAHNMGYGAIEYIDALPGEAIAELHLGVFTVENDVAYEGGVVLIDTHASPIAEPAWELYAHTISRFGPKLTLIEWDNDVPALPALLAEATRADEIATESLQEEPCHVAAQ
jgi:uncharacterized protein (UPF0276 family)